MALIRVLRYMRRYCSVHSIHRCMRVLRSTYNNLSIGEHTANPEAHVLGGVLSVMAVVCSPMLS